MNTPALTVRELLDQELERRCHASGIEMKTESLFARDCVVNWIEALVGKSISGKLADCIKKTSVERLGHTVSTYLLGMALRSRLGLRFDKMPRIIAHSASDGFHFFWALICLCHDLGYRFEHEFKGKADILGKLGNAADRLELLGIDRDLFGVNQSELARLNIDPASEEGRWILDSVELAKKYDRYRRQTKHESEYPAVADHGIYGALLLYDILYTEYEEMCRKRRLRRFDHPTRHSETETTGNLDGVAKDSSPTRFIRCSLLIACTVARHNMWVANQTTLKTYQDYELTALIPNHDGVKVCADKAMEQMLFFLDFVDTIDPVKYFYVRDVENGARKGERDRCYSQRLQQQYDFVMNHVYLDIPEGEDDDQKRTFAIWTNSQDPEDLSLFRRFTGTTSSLPDWLEIPVPTVENNRISYIVPFVPGKKNIWSFNITDDEVNSLLLYMGGGVPGKYGAFYSSTRAYQTFNLLMMKGNEGEQIRVCDENQHPNGVFLREWERSLETMEHIFRAQCKYGRQKSIVLDTLFRSDRKLNFEMMKERGATYAMTSTSQGSYLPEFLEDKEEPRVLSMRMSKPIPYFDYEGFFGEEYVYADEREILLPPMISIEAKEQSSFALTAADKVVQWYDLDLFAFDPGSGWEEDRSENDDSTDRAYLKDHAAEAAEALDHLAKTHDWNTSPLTNDTHAYWQWKKAYRRVLSRRMRKIYDTTFNPA